MSNNLPPTTSDHYKDTHEINNYNIVPTDSKISRLGLIASGFAGLTVSTISHILIVSHIKGVPLRKQILPCLAVAGVGAVTGVIANRSIGAVSQDQNPPTISENIPVIK